MTKTNYWQNVVGINDLDAVILPNMTTAQRDFLSMGGVPTGTLIFNTDRGAVEEYTGSGWYTQLNILHLSRLGELAALTSRPPLVYVDSATSSLDGITAQNDGGGGWFRWVPGLTEADDGLTCISPSGSPLGRYVSGNAQMRQMSTSRRDSITSPITGTLIYNSTKKAYEYRTSSTWVSFATLDSNGVLDASQIPSSILGSLSYQGTWDASTNTPTILNGTGVQGQFYIVATAGNTTLDGESDWNVSDWALFNGTIWQKVPSGLTSDAITTALGYTPVDQNRIIATSARLAGGGNLSADRTLDLATVSVSGSGPKPTVDAYGRVTALSALISSDITGPLGYVPINPTRSILTSARLSGGGDLSADRTIDLATVSVTGSGPKPTVDAYGRVTALAALDSTDITGPLGYVPVNPTRSILTSARLSGGGDLSADRTLDLATVSVTGSGPKPTVDSYGRVTALAALASGDITGPLGYTPLNPANNLSEVTAQTAITNLSGAFQVATLTAFKALTARPPLVHMVCRSTAGDKGGGLFYWVASDATTADDALVVAPTSGPSGRYKRVFNGSSVSPFWWGCGQGSDDVTAFDKIIATGYAIDLSGGTFKVANTISDASGCKRVFSDGTGTIIPPSTSTYTTNLFVVTKSSDIEFDRIKFDGSFPNTITIQSDLPCSTAIRVSNNINRVKVTNCQFYGCGSAIMMLSTVSYAEITNNFMTGSFIDSIGMDAPQSCLIADNVLIDAAITPNVTGPNGTTSGAIRIGHTSQHTTTRSIIIRGNQITRGAAPSGQNGIDCFSGAACIIRIENNVLDECGTGIELKTFEPWTTGAAGDPDVYQAITVSNNTIRMRTDTITSGISLNIGGSVAIPQGKISNVVIDGNHIFCSQTPAIGSTTSGITISGYRNTVISNNTIRDVNQGISYAGGLIDDNAIWHLQIIGNSINSLQSAIVRGTSGQTDYETKIINNPLIRSETSTAIYLAFGTTKNITISGNYISGLNGFELRGVQDSLITRNTIVGRTNAFFSQATAPSNVEISNNKIKTQIVGLASIRITAGGSGLTNGTRTFTVTSGTSSFPAVFTATVSGGIVTAIGTLYQGARLVRVHNRGSGLTNGTRTFTVTSGTGTVQTQFTATVKNGVINSLPVITVAGNYSVFPSSPTVTVDSGSLGGAVFSLEGSCGDFSGSFVYTPTVTVDSGIVGGATFQLVPTASHAFSLNVGSGINILDNNIDVPITAMMITGAASYSTSNNTRGITSVDPNGLYAGSVGDIVYNASGNVTGTNMGWICTSASSPAPSSSWAPYGVIGSKNQISRTTNLGLTSAASGTIYDNIGASGSVVFTLPTAARGLEYTFVVAVAQTVQITAGASTVIGFGSSVSATAGNISSATLYATVTLKAFSSTLWVVTSYSGDWTVN